MLHIVQVVFAGKAETPQVFLDQAGAESAYVEHVKKCWKQSYSAYCDQNGVGMDCFSSAKDFLDTLDLSEKSQVNYWVVNPDDAGSDKMKHLEWIKQRRENIDNLVKKVEQRSAIVREGLTGLLDDMAKLTECFDAIDGAPAEVQAVGPKDDAALSPPKAVQEEPEESAEYYTTKEWQAYVATIMNMYGGSRSEFPPLSRPDWRQDVYSDSTSLEYWDWVAAKIKKHREKAEKANYTVLKDPDSPGHYKIRTPEGTVGETSFYSEWEAWCHAGMNLTEEPAAVR